MKYHIIDAFTDKLFGGNPAGVCIIEEWPEDELLQNIAMENNLSETAFAVRCELDGYYGLRWFTPAIEVELCGHATLATAFVLFEEAESEADEIKFKTKSGMLTVTRENDMLYLNFPAYAAAEIPIYDIFEKALGVKPIAAYKALDFIVEVDSQETLLNINPDFELLKQIKTEAKMSHNDFGIIVTARATANPRVIVTAKGDDCDFVSRFFAPNAGINEDPVTGRAHSSLTPFWSERLGKTKLTAKQLSKRGGTLYCENLPEQNHVKIGGKCVRYLKGVLQI
jgi:PhzF family phenazine biosynthesis protein